MRGGKRRAFVVFAVHESSSDPIMTEAALPLSPTANLRLHAFNTHHTHSRKNIDAQVATAISVRTFFLCVFSSENAKVTAFVPESTKNTLTRLQFADTLTTNKIRPHNTLHCVTFDSKIFPVTYICFLTLEPHNSINTLTYTVTFCYSSEKMPREINRISLVEMVILELRYRLVTNFSITINVHTMLLSHVVFLTTRSRQSRNLELI